MSASAVRWVVIAVCAAGIAGMVVTSINGANDGAMAFGIVTSAAILCMIVATAVGNATTPTSAAAELIAARLEDRIAEVVDQGADEATVRALVAEAVRYGRATS